MSPNRLTRFGLGALLGTGLGLLWWGDWGRVEGVAAELRLVQRSAGRGFAMVLDHFRERAIASDGSLKGMLSAGSRVGTPQLPQAAAEEVFDLTQVPIPGQKIIHFGSMEDLLAFVADAQRQGLKLGPVIDMLRTVQIFGAISDFEALLPEGSVAVDNHPVRIPEIGVQRLGTDAQSQGTGDAWALMGASNRPEYLGEGVRIAVLDTGVPPLADLREGMTGAYNFLDPSASAADLNGHGTQVASLLFGKVEGAQGIAPHALPEYYKILDDKGFGDAYTMAQAIVAAVVSDVPIIIIPSITYADDPTLKASIDYATSRGVIVVAPAGNDARSQPAYPAAYPDVVCTAGLNPDGTPSNFSNSGDHVDFSLPAEQILVRGLDGVVKPDQGTSYGPPQIAGPIAEIVRTHHLQPTTEPIKRDVPSAPSIGRSDPLYASAGVPLDAVDIIRGVSNDVEAPGPDQHTGHGIPYLDRLLNLGAYGYRDMAVTAVRVPSPSEDPTQSKGLVSGTQIPVQIVVQNQGNEVITSGVIRVKVGDFYEVVEPIEIALGTNETVSLILDLTPEHFRNREGLNVSARVEMNGSDSNRSNDSVTVNFRLGR